MEISSNTSCSNEDGSINITYSCTASCGDVPSLILLINGEPKEPIDPHIDVATKCTQDMCVTNINTNLECNSQSGNITRTIEGTVSANDVNNSYMYAIECCLPERRVLCFFFQDYIVTNSPQCTNGSSNISLATVTVTTTVTECSLNLESSYISFPSPSIIPSPSLYISTVTTSKVTSPSSSQSLSLSLSSSLSTTSQYTTTSTLTRSSSSLTRSSSSLSDNISLTSSTEPTLTTQGLTSEYLAIINITIVSFCT